MAKKSGAKAELRRRGPARGQNEPYWSYRAPKPPTAADLPPGAFSGTEKEFSSLSPGMRREIERQALRAQAKTTPITDVAAAMKPTMQWTAQGPKPFTSGWRNVLRTPSGGVRPYVSSREEVQRMDRNYRAWLQERNETRDRLAGKGEMQGPPRPSDAQLHEQMRGRLDALLAGDLKKLGRTLGIIDGKGRSLAGGPEHAKTLGAMSAQGLRLNIAKQGREAVYKAMASARIGPPMWSAGYAAPRQDVAAPPKPQPVGMDGLTRAQRSGKSPGIVAAPALTGSTPMERFRSSYEATLVQQIKANPGKYSYGVERAPEMAKRMVEALAQGTGDHTSPTVKAVAKSMGIKPTVGGLKAALNDQPPPTPRPQKTPLEKAEAAFAAADKARSKGWRDMQARSISPARWGEITRDWQAKKDALTALKGSGESPGWSDAARDASAKSRGVALPGEAKPRSVGKAGQRAADARMAAPKAAKRGGIKGKALSLLAPIAIGAAMVSASRDAKAEGADVSGQVKAAGAEGAKSLGTMAAFTAGATLAAKGLVKSGLSVARVAPVMQGAMIAAGAIHGAITAKPGERLKGAMQGGFDMSLPGMVWNTGKAVAEAVKPRQPMTQEQASRFQSENAAFEGMRKLASSGSADGAPRGWANPANQLAAQTARGVENVTDWAKAATPSKKGP